MTGHPSFLRESKASKDKSKASKGTKKARIDYMADFETTTDPADCRVWLWGFVAIYNAEYDNVEIGLDIDSFMKRAMEHNSTIYFHNLKFDGMFILDWLLKNGYTHSTAQNLRQDKTFKSLISDNGIFYSITIRWENGHSCELRDSYKKLPMPVSRIATSFNLPETKGSIDYEAYRPVGHKPTSEEEDYIRKDLVIPAKALKEVLDSGMTGLTVAGDSLREYKRLTGSEHFKRMFPVLHESIDSEIRRAYRGGFTYADERFKGRVVGGGIVLDVNSLYPSIMKNKILPYGEPKFVRGMVEPTVDRPLVIFSVTFTAKIKPNHIPCIQIKGSSIFTATEYLKEIKEPTTLMVTNVDWDLYNDHYDIDVLAYGGGWAFRAVKGMFDVYIDKWSEVKIKEKGGKREIAKLHLNSLYGKFATNPNVTCKIPTLVDGAVKLVRGEDEKVEPVYTAAGVFITSFARDLTIRSAQRLYPQFAYADTDSLHLIGDYRVRLDDDGKPQLVNAPEGIEVHPTKLGAWKFEYAFDSAFYIRAKAYLEHLPDVAADCEDETCDERHDYVTRIAGLPTAIASTLTFDKLRPGLVLNGKLTPKTVPGGVVLRDTPFELKLN